MNSDLMHTMMLANPKIKALMEKNPEFAQMMNNPTHLKEVRCAVRRLRATQNRILWHPPPIYVS